MKKRFLTYSIFLALAGLGISQANAQQTLKIGTNPTTVTNGVVLDVEANNKGVLFPRVALTGTNDVATIASPVNALTVFNTATAGTAPNEVTPGYYYYNTATAKWVRLITVGDLRLVGTNNHISQDAGVGGNGTSVGSGTDNVGIGSNTFSSNTSGKSNLAIGTNALAKNTSGTYNLALGENALNANTAGGTNVAIGTEALALNTSSSGNVAVGYYALRSNSGSSNIAIGSSALANNTAGGSQIAIGASALNSNTTGTRNIAIGAASLFNNISGLGNVTLGNQSLKDNTTGNENVAIGAQSLVANKVGSGNVAIGNGASSQFLGNNNTSIGNLAGGGITSGNNNVLIGANSGPFNNGPMSNQLFISNKLGEDALVRGDFAAGTVTINNAVGTSNSPANTSTLNLNGSMSASIITVTADYTATDQDYTIIAKSNSTINITFPNAATNKGRMYNVIAYPKSNGNVVLVGAVGLYATVEKASYSGASTWMVQSDGTEWIVISAGGV